MEAFVLLVVITNLEVFALGVDHINVGALNGINLITGTGMSIAGNVNIVIGLVCFNVDGQRNICGGILDEVDEIQAQLLGIRVDEGPSHFESVTRNDLCALIWVGNLNGRGKRSKDREENREETHVGRFWLKSTTWLADGK